MTQYNRLRLGLLSLIFVMSAARAQISPSPVHNLVAQYEALSSAERVAFLQTIALLGFQPTTVVPNTVEAAGLHPGGTKTGTTVPEVVNLPEANASNEDVSVIKLAEPSLTQTSADEPKNQIRLVTRKKVAYAFTDSRNQNQSVFSLLLPEYNQKISDPSQKITANELRDEAINFFASNLEQDLNACGFQVISTAETAEEQSRYNLEAGINRIVINKTLLETSLIGEASARLEDEESTEQNNDPIATIKARTVEEISSDDKDGYGNQLKSALGSVMTQLSKQISDKLCSIKL